MTRCVSFRSGSRILSLALVVSTIYLRARLVSISIRRYLHSISSSCLSSRRSLSLKEKVYFQVTRYYDLYISYYSNH
ncbi:uncharacterized protein V2V93DRAFT_370618 [Kockiozyma suomiensis]|uniref:uncharacterized protein n=1 Tax=Kockiozyma suomiensis TaxID=1337062 RepID=UPI003343AE74